MCKAAGWRENCVGEAVGVLTSFPTAADPGEATDPGEAAPGVSICREVLCVQRDPGRRKTPVVWCGHGLWEASEFEGLSEDHGPHEGGINPTKVSSGQAEAEYQAGGREMVEAAQAARCECR